MTIAQKKFFAISMVILCALALIAVSYYFLSSPGSSIVANSASNRDLVAPAIAKPPSAPVVADESAPVRITYATGAHTEIAPLGEGAKYFAGRNFTVGHLPPEMSGLVFTRRGVNQSSSVEVHGAKGTTVYLLASAPKNPQPPDPTWERVGTAECSDKNHTQLAIYKRDFTSDADVTLATVGWAGTVLAARKLEVAAFSPPPGPKPTAAPPLAEAPTRLLVFVFATPLRATASAMN